MNMRSVLVKTVTIFLLMGGFVCLVPSWSQAQLVLKASEEDNVLIAQSGPQGIDLSRNRIPVQIDPPSLQSRIVEHFQLFFNNNANNMIAFEYDEETAQIFIKVYRERMNEGFEDSAFIQDLLAREFYYE